MRRRSLVIASSFFTLASAAPFLTAPKVVAQAQSQAGRQKFRSDDADAERVFDREHGDYHVWDANEDRAYHRYWEEQHRAFREYSKLNARQQCNYWKWRHSHPDG